MSDEMETVIEDAVNDSLAADAPVDTSSDVDTGGSDGGSYEVPSPSGSSDTGADHPVAPGAAAAASEQDDFDKKWGIAAHGVTGRENRIPHSRVKQMVTKAEQDALARAVKESEGKFSPRIAEFETKVRDYEDRLQRVAQFEHVLENDPQRFLGMLSQIPAYKQFFDYIGQLASGNQPQTQQQAYLDQKDMPQPDITYGDGSKGYSPEQLARRDEWFARQIEAKAVSAAEQRLTERYRPIEQEWQQHQRMQQIVPVVEQQIAEARTWPNFNELEPTVVQLLKSDPNISLERAYMRAYQENVIPKLSTDRSKIRSEVLAEIQKRPTSSAAPLGAAKPTPVGQNQSRSMEQVIEDSLREAGLL